MSTSCRFPTLDYDDLRSSTEDEYSVQNAPASEEEPGQESGIETKEDTDHSSRNICALFNENRRLSRENQALRHCLILTKENCDLKTSNYVTSALAWCDDRLRLYHKDFSKCKTDNLCPDSMRQPSAFKPVTPKSQQTKSPKEKLYAEDWCFGTPCLMPRGKLYAEDWVEQNPCSIYPRHTSTPITTPMPDSQPWHKTLRKYDAPPCLSTCKTPSKAKPKSASYAGGATVRKSGNIKRTGIPLPFRRVKEVDVTDYSFGRQGSFGFDSPANIRTTSSEQDSLGFETFESTSTARPPSPRTALFVDNSYEKPRGGRSPTGSRSPSPEGRRTPSPRQSPTGRQTPSPGGARTSSPKQSPVGRVAQIPVNRQIPSPAGRQSPSPAGRRSPSPVGTRVASESGMYTMTLTGRRSPPPTGRLPMRQSLRQSSPTDRQSPSPTGRVHVSPLGRSGTPSPGRSLPFSARRLSPSPAGRVSPTPVGRSISPPAGRPLPFSETQSSLPAGRLPLSEVAGQTSSQAGSSSPGSVRRRSPSPTGMLHQLSPRRSPSPVAKFVSPVEPVVRNEYSDKTVRQQLVFDSPTYRVTSPSRDTPRTNTERSASSPPRPYSSQTIRATWNPLTDVSPPRGHKSESHNRGAITLKRKPTPRSPSPGRIRQGSPRLLAVDPLRKIPLLTEQKYRSKSADTSRPFTATDDTNKSYIDHNVTWPFDGTSYDLIGQPVAASTPVTRSKKKARSPSNRTPAATSYNETFGLSRQPKDALQDDSLAKLLGMSGRGAGEKARGVVYRAVDTLTGYQPNLTSDVKFTLSQVKHNKRIVGEIAFQLDRRILEYVFSPVRTRKKNARYYGYSLTNIMQMIFKESSKAGFYNPRIELELRSRLDNIVRKLAAFGYNLDRFAEKSQDMVNKYGLLNGPPDQTTLRGFGLDDPAVLRVILSKVISDETELHDMLIMLDCLCYLSYEDGEPLFMW